jgi:hypothetical protein
MAGLTKAAPAYAKAKEEAAAAARRRGTLRPRAHSSATPSGWNRARRDFMNCSARSKRAGKNPQAALVQFQQSSTARPGLFQTHGASRHHPVPARQQGRGRTAAHAGHAAVCPTRTRRLLHGSAVRGSRGNTAEAVKYYKMVAGSKSQIGTEAMTRLTRLDLGHEPTDLSGDPAPDGRAGCVWLTVGNRTSVPITAVTIVVGVVDQAGPNSPGPRASPAPGTRRSPRARPSICRHRSDHSRAGTFLGFVKWKIEGAQAQ